MLLVVSAGGRKQRNFVSRTVKEVKQRQFRERRLITKFDEGKESRLGVCRFPEGFWLL